MSSNTRRSLELVTGRVLRVRWLDDERLWYRVTRGAGASEVVRFDCETGEREVTTAPTKTPLPRLTSPRGSARTGDESAILFVNQAGREVELFWLRGDGSTKSYGHLREGAERRQHTYGGHRWLIRTTDGTALAVFEADDVPRRAVITSEPLPRVSPDGVERYPSPDGRAVLKVHRERPPRRTITLVDSRTKTQTTVPYAKPGDPIDRLRLRLLPRGHEVPLDGARFGNPWSITDVRWSPDSRRVTFIYNERGHQLLRLVAIDTDSGIARSLIEERSDTFVDYPSKIHCRFVGDAILWMSERDGHNHLYLFDAETGALRRRLTEGPFCVRRVLHVNEERVLFIACGVREGEDPYHQHLCRVTLDGSRFARLTDADGTHAIWLSPDARRFVATHSRIDDPGATEIRATSDGRLLHELERADASALVEAGWAPPERFVAKGRDGATDIHGVLIYPERFDPNAAYPVVEETYTSPNGQHVPKRFELLERQRAIADRGFVVVMIDGMGTNWRSKAFHDVAWQRLEDAGFPDRKRWIRAAASTRPFMDLDRVGIYGGSAGGQAAARALIDHHDLYRVAVADCGCHDNRMDKRWWNELWLGWPVGEAYERASNVAHAHRLEGELLLIVGELDDNVDPAATFAFAKALERAGKRFTLEVIPGAGHGAAETERGSRLRADFLVKHLQPEACADRR